jgi:hypothetical protein
VADGALGSSGYIERESKAPERHISHATVSAEGRTATITPINTDCMAGLSPASLPIFTGQNLFNFDHPPATTITTTRRLGRSYFGGQQAGACGSTPYLTSRPGLRPTYGAMFFPRGWLIFGSAIEPTAANL